MREWLILQITKFMTFIMTKRAVSEVEEEERKCPVCGEEWEKGEIFCYYCGYEEQDELHPLHPPPLRDGAVVDPGKLLDENTLSEISSRISKIGVDKKIDIAVLLLSDELRRALEPRMDNADGVVDITRSVEGLSFAIYNNWFMGKDTELKGLLVVLDPEGEDRAMVQGRNGPGLSGSKFRSWFDGFEITPGMDEKTALVKELELIATNLESI